MFKKFLAYFLILSLLLPAIPVQAESVPSIYKMVASGTVTQANMRISAAAGVSFVDFSDSEAAGNKLINHLGYLLKIKDSAGKVIQGFVRNAGTAEAAVTDVLSGWNLTSGWTAGAGCTIDDANSFTLAGGGGPYSTPPITKGGLYKGQIVVTNGGYLIDSSSGAVIFGPESGAVGYATAIGTDVRVFHPFATATYDITSMTLFRVTAPSATGVTISSTKGGTSLDNWAAKDSTFNYNDASGYSYELWRVNNTVLLDTDSVLNADATIVMTAGSAAWSAVGIDDSAYLDGQHIIHITDAAGVVAFGYYKSAGAGAVVTTNGGATQNWLYIGTGFSTAGNFTRKIYFVGSP